MDMDSFFVANVSCRLAAKEKKAGKDSLNGMEKTIVYICHTKGLVGNGGIDYFLAWEDADETICKMFEDISANDVAEVMKKVFSLFPGMKKGLSSAAREKLLRSSSATIKKSLKAAEREFYNCQSEIIPNLSSYIRAHWDDIEESLDTYYVFWV